MKRMAFYLLLYRNVSSLSIIPSHRVNTLLTDTTSPAPTLLFLKISGGTAVIITVIYKILSIRYRFHCCSRVDGPVQKWVGDLWNLTNAIPLCRCLLFKHKEMPAFSGWKAGWIKAAQILHITLFINIKLCWGWLGCLFTHLTCIGLLFVLCFC